MTYLTGRFEIFINLNFEYRKSMDEDKRLNLYQVFLSEICI